MPLRISSVKIEEDEKKQSVLPEKRASLSDVFTDIKQRGYKPVVGSDDTQLAAVVETSRQHYVYDHTEEIPDERVLVSDEQPKEPLPWSEFNRVLAETELRESKNVIKDPYDLVADIFMQNAVLGPRQKYKYELFCNVIRILFKQQHKLGYPGITKATIQRGITATSRMEVPAILVAAERKGIINRFEVRERIVYALTMKCAVMLEENLLEKLRETME